MVATPGVSTSAIGAPGGDGARSMRETAISTFAAYSQALQRATRSSPALDGAMYSCARLPPMIPVSDSTL